MTNAKPDEPLKVSYLIGKPPKPRKHRGKITRNAKRASRRWNMAAKHYRKLADELKADGHSDASVKQLVQRYY